MSITHQSKTKSIIKKPIYSIVKNNIKISEISPGNSINGLPLGAYVTNVNDFWRKGYDGTGLIIAVIDDGIDQNHPALISCPDKSQKVLGEFTFVSGGRIPQIGKQHGTAVAGLISGWSQKGYRGMAPNSKLYSFNVFDTDDEATVDDIVTAMHKAIDLGCNIINLSLGQTTYNQRLTNAIKFAFARNILCVCSAGNLGPNTVLYPAAVPEAISVGSVRYNYATGRILESSFSSTNNNVDCCAVGEGLLACNSITNDLFIVSGTSFSTAIVTGFLAILYQYIKNKQVNTMTTLTSDVITNLLYANTLDLFTLGRDNVSGVGFVFKKGINGQPIVVRTF